MAFYRYDSPLALALRDHTTQQVIELADQVGTTYKQISRWVQGARPQPHNAYRIARALGTTTDELFGFNVDDLFPPHRAEGS